MIRRSTGLITTLVPTVLLGLLLTSDVDAKGGGHSRGRAPRPHASHHQPAHRSSAPAKASRTPHPNVTAARARANVARSNNNPARANNNTAHATNNNNLNRTTLNPSTAARSSASVNRTGTSRYNYSRGYGRGYQNHYVGNRNYGRSQSNARSIVARLRSVHATLARIDHDYNGHRARAQHHISQAIHQLSHRSSSSRYYGSTGQNNTVLALNNNRNRGNRNLNGNNNGQGRQRMSQAQSDSRMRQALRTTQGISMQLSHQGQNSTNHSRAHGHLQYALHEMNVALTVR